MVSSPRLAVWQCRLFCSGSNCRYCVYSARSNDALKGIYSSWITESIVGMARPNSALIQSGLLEEFEKYDIKSIFNLQSPFEHSHCGTYKVLTRSGFTYDPEQDLMSNDISHYNFIWPDFGAQPSFCDLLDVVKVLANAVKKHKAAVHCHAGLGRTGVLIACFLVFQQGLEPDSAIDEVRKRRAGSIQTRWQIRAVRDFHARLQRQKSLFGFNSLKCSLVHQRMFMHGEEVALYRHLPRTVVEICDQTLKIIAQSHEGDNEVGNNFAKEISDNVFEAILKFKLREDRSQIWIEHHAWNQGWQGINSIKDVNLLMNLLMSWLEHLKQPVIKANEIIRTHSDDNAQLSEIHLVHHLVNFLTLVAVVNQDFQLDKIELVLKKLIMVLTQSDCDEKKDSENLNILINTFKVSYEGLKFMERTEKSEETLISPNNDDLIDANLVEVGSNENLSVLEEPQRLSPAVDGWINEEIRELDL